MYSSVSTASPQQFTHRTQRGYHLFYSFYGFLRSLFIWAQLTCYKNLVSGNTAISNSPALHGLHVHPQRGDSGNCLGVCHMGHFSARFAETTSSRWHTVSPQLGACSLDFDQCSTTSAEKCPMWHAPEPRACNTTGARVSISEETQPSNLLMVFVYAGGINVQETTLQRSHDSSICAVICQPTRISEINH